MTITQHTEPLNRVEADIVVRQLTGRYYDKYGYGASSFHTEERFAEFCKDLAESIGGEDTSDYRSYLESVLFIISELDFDYWTHRSDNAHRDYWESELNDAVHRTLSAANMPGPMRFYYTQPVAA